jgi:hypothetical protein
MPRVRRGATLWVAVALATVPVAAGAPPATACRHAEQATALGREAYLYGFPLLEFLRVRGTPRASAAPTAAGKRPAEHLQQRDALHDAQQQNDRRPETSTPSTRSRTSTWGAGGRAVASGDAGGATSASSSWTPTRTRSATSGLAPPGARPGASRSPGPGGLGRRQPGTRLIRSPYRRLWVIGRTLATDRPDQRRAIRLMRRYRLTPPGGGARPERLPAEPPAPGAYADRPGVPERAGPRAAREPTAGARPRRAPAPGGGGRRAGAQPSRARLGARRAAGARGRLSTRPPARYPASPATP